MCSGISGGNRRENDEREWIGDPDHQCATRQPLRTEAVDREVAKMRKQYDFSKAKKNPYARRLKKQITLRIDEPPCAPAGQADRGTASPLIQGARRT
jgi:hypothetical protein